MSKLEEVEVGQNGRTTADVVTPGGQRIPVTEVISDYRLAVKSRQASLIGRREVLSGKAKFGIFGDGKEVAQIALAKVFRDGDWRAGYYRDQTFMFAAGISNLDEYFAQLYADSDRDREPASRGRQMSSHFATRSLDDAGNWILPQTHAKHSSADVSSTAAQMARMVGLGYASKLFRMEPSFSAVEGFSNDGDEVVFGTIGNASTSEGQFWEAVNAAGVLQIPMLLSVWDDDYGISVPNEYQTTKGSISEALAGLRPSPGVNGVEIYVVKGWDYEALIDTYFEAIEKVRRDHAPALVHVVEMTQPQGHSTSGSHERYKPQERLAWEEEYDCISQMRSWLVDEGISTSQQLDEFEQADRAEVESQKRKAWDAYQAPLAAEQAIAIALIDAAASAHPEAGVSAIAESLQNPFELNRKAVQSHLIKAALAVRKESSGARTELLSHLEEYRHANLRMYNSHLLSESAESPLRVEGVEPVYSDFSEEVAGRQILVKAFDNILASDPRVFIIGEDVGKLGGVNVEFEGLHESFGEHRVTDTGIREATILGQGIGAALRGLRPVVDIQYLDYLIYALQGLSDDLATLRYRTAGGQKAPVIVRNKGHRLQGIWHTGSPMGMILHSCRGIHLCVPRDMTRAAGMYNTLLVGDDPAIVIEVLAGYRVKEKVPDNLGAYRVPLGIPEILRPGDDVTVITYGQLCRLATQAAGQLAELGINIELIDVQTLSPFDVKHSIVESIKKTNAVLFLDEDVPGGASAYMMQEVLERQDAWGYLDAPPATLTASPNRSAFAEDGDYFTKPSIEDIIERVYDLMHERNPQQFPAHRS